LAIKDQEKLGVFSVGKAILEEINSATDVFRICIRVFDSFIYL
jgi:hypothetical protein